MRTQERAAELYEQHKSLVEGIAVNFAHKYQKDVEESLSQANLIFMQVFARHEDAKGDFKVRLLHLLPRRLKGTLRISDSVVRFDTRRARTYEPPFFFLSCDLLESSCERVGEKGDHDNHRTIGIDFVPDMNTEEDPSFDYRSLSSLVSSDAGLVLKEIENISGDVALVVGDTVNSKHAMYKFRKFVRIRLGWSQERTVKAFNELSGLRGVVAC